MVWDPVFFMKCEEEVNLLEQVEKIERDVLYPNTIKFLDINEIKWEDR